jgi:alkylation response protein AidB-like acyl-CoA dehydrogenase
VYFGLPDDATALREGLREVLTTACSPATIRAAWEGSDSAALWKELGSFGVPGVLVPEGRGGLGLDEHSFVAAAEECGYAGVPGPLVETLAFLPVVDLPADGSARIAVQRGGTHVPYAGVATHVFRTYDGELLTPASSGGVETVDPSRAVAELEAAPSLATVAQEQYDRLWLAQQRATLGTAAFLLGLARRQVDLTIAYAKDRKQFGVAIGTFQAIKHPITDAVVGTEFAWPAVLRAAQSLIDSDPDAELHVSMAKALASDAAYRVSRVCLQAHGAMAYTVEYDLHLFAKRTWALSKDWGTAPQHRAIVAKRLGIERTAQ